MTPTHDLSDREALYAANPTWRRPDAVDVHLQWYFRESAAAVGFKSGQGNFNGDSGGTHGQPDSDGKLIRRGVVGVGNEPSAVTKLRGIERCLEQLAIGDRKTLEAAYGFDAPSVARDAGLRNLLGPMGNVIVLDVQCAVGESIHDWFESLSHVARARVRLAAECRLIGAWNRWRELAMTAGVKRGRRSFGEEA